MQSVFVTSLLFCLTFEAAAFCVPTEYTMFVENKDCAYCLAVNTTVCAGFCHTQDPNLKEGLLKSTLAQTTCTYKAFVRKTVLIPGCPLHVNPYFSYPAAITCKCNKCNTDYSDCVHEPIKNNYCTKPQKTYSMRYTIGIQ
ncbi:thyrotropin subunit beta [Ambystoma mexicanum]|uniref:thyrotropin subunit beta n=1 Tax=Ambystoma mexicanum TaxID=8296 RepID=UPI0037E90C29